MSRMNCFIVPSRLMFSAAVAAVSLSAVADASTYYWDGGTADIATNGNGASAGTAGTWDTTIKNFDQGNGLAHIAWPNSADEAVFAGTAGTVTIGAPISLNKLTVGTANYTFSGTNTLSFTGTTPNINITVTNTFLSAPIAGGITVTNLNAAGTGNIASSALILSGNNTGLTSLTVNMPTTSTGVVGANAGAFGTAANGALKISAGTVNLGTNATTGSGFSFNAVATELAGGTLRARTGSNTWNGAITLTANSSLESRTSSGTDSVTGLTLSSTGTITLGSNTLTLNGAASTTRADTGITLNGVISGTGSLATASTNVQTTLAAANSYSGGTTVAGGNLTASTDGALGTGNVTVTSGSLTVGGGTLNDYVADTATLSLIGTTAAVDVLNYVGTDTVAALFLNGVSQPAGVYGSAGSGAANTSALFGGTGTITVVPEPAAGVIVLLASAAALTRRRRIAVA